MSLAQHILIAVITIANCALCMKRGHSSSFETAMGILISVAVIVIVLID